MLGKLRHQAAYGAIGVVGLFPHTAQLGERPLGGAQSKAGVRGSPALQQTQHRLCLAHVSTDATPLNEVAGWVQQRCDGLFGGRQVVGG